MRKHLARGLFGIAMLAAMGATVSKAEIKAGIWPSRPIRIVVPTAPGTPPDILSRVLAAELGKEKGWSVIVENKVGAVQTTAAADVARSPADGYSLLAISLPIAAAPALLQSVPFSLEKDFAPVVKLGVSYNILIAPMTHKANSMRELEAIIKAQPGKQSYASGGFGTPAHLIGELFRQQTHADVAHVPYNVPASAINDLMSGTVDYAFFTTLPVVGLVREAKLKALAVSSPKRLKAFPDTPTTAEAGYPGLEIEDWSGLLVRAGTPREVIDRLNAAVNDAMKAQQVREAFDKLGAVPQGGKPDEFGALLKSEIARWTNVIKQADIKIAQ